LVQKVILKHIRIIEVKKNKEGQMHFPNKIFTKISAAMLCLSAVTLTTDATAQASVRASVLHSQVNLSGYITTPKWTKCNKKFLCASVQVPLSYENPRMGKINLAIIEAPATHPSAASDIFINPGGPGVSGVQFLESYYSQFPVSLRNNFNLISWDPRGVGKSDPVTCESTQQLRSFFALNPAPSTKKEITQVLNGTKAFVKACLQHTPKRLLENISTVATARDLNLLRMDLHQPKINYLGFSYGTLLGQVYAQIFPTTIRAMALDGVVNPDLNTLQLDAAQAAGFEKELNIFFHYCDKDSTCSAALPGGSAALYRSIMAGFRSGSTVVGELEPKYGGNITVNYALALSGVIGALYSPKTWPLLGTGLGDVLTQGNGQVLAGLAFSYDGLQLNGQFSNQAEANIAINCLDSPSLGSLQQIKKDASKLAKKYPDFGAPAVWGSLACNLWPIKPQIHPSIIHAPHSPTILLVGSTGDPATPYQWARSVAKQLDNAVLLTRAGNGHIAYFASKCVQKDVDSYFTNLQLPKKNTVCK